MKITKAQRTQAIIEKFKGLPGEFYMLKGLLILDYAVEGAAADGDYLAKNAQAEKVRAIYDTTAIAQRMDAITREQLEGLKKSLDIPA